LRVVLKVTGKVFQLGAKEASFVPEHVLTEVLLDLALERAVAKVETVQAPYPADLAKALQQAIDLRQVQRSERHAAARSIGDGGCERLCVVVFIEPWKDCLQVFQNGSLCREPVEGLSAPVGRAVGHEAPEWELKRRSFVAT